jgi:hypothetical protein
MTHLRRTLGLLAASALTVALVPGLAQADDSKTINVPTAGPALAAADAARTLPAVTGDAVQSEFFAGHQDVSADAVANEGTFRVHSFECTDADEGVLSSVLTYDDFGFLNGGPGIFMYCTGGEQTYAPVFIDFFLGSVPTEGAVAAGDMVRMSAERADGVATYTMENITQGWTESFEGTGDYVNGLVQIGDAAINLGGPDLEPPVFGRDPVRYVTLDSQPLSASGSLKTQMVDADGTVVERATKYRAVKPDERFALIKES